MLSDQVIRLIGETFGTSYTKPTEFVQNVVSGRWKTGVAEYPRT